MSNKEFAVKNSDGSTNKIKVYRNDLGSVDDPIVLIFPAMGITAGFYEKLAIECTENGLIAITCDLRGNGASSVRAGWKTNFSYKTMLDQDYKGIFRTVRDLFPDNDLYPFGHSLGGQLACLYLARGEAKVKGMIMVATCSVYHKAWSGFNRWKTLWGTQFVNNVAQVVGYFPGNIFNFGGREARGVIHDWSQQAQSGNYILAGDKFNYEKALKEMHIPALFISFEEDHLAPRSAVEHLYQKFGNARDVWHIHLLKNDLGNEGFNHFNWARKPGFVARQVREWVKGNIG